MGEDGEESEGGGEEVIGEGDDEGGGGGGASCDRPGERCGWAEAGWSAMWRKMSRSCVSA